MMNAKRLISVLPGAVVLVTAAFLAGEAKAQDAITLGAGNISGGTANQVINIPIFVRDKSLAPSTLDENTEPAAIQGIGVRVNFSPAASVASASIARSVTCTGPATDVPASGSGFASLATVAQLATNNFAFTLDAPAPGNQCMTLTLTLSGAPTFPINVSLDSAFANLSDQFGTAATQETVGNGRLQALGGVTITPVELQAFDAE